jgi:hypothetical protein
MHSQPNEQFQPYFQSVDDILSAMKLKERYIEEVNTADFSDASEKIRDKLLAFEALFSAVRQSGPSDRNSISLTGKQRALFEKVIEDANLGIESHSLKVIRDSINDLEAFRDRIINS